MMPSDKNWIILGNLLSSNMFKYAIRLGNAILILLVQWYCFFETDSLTLGNNNIVFIYKAILITLSSFGSLVFTFLYNYFKKKNEGLENPSHVREKNTRIILLAIILFFGAVVETVQLYSKEYIFFNIAPNIIYTIVGCLLWYVIAGRDFRQRIPASNRFITMSKKNQIFLILICLLVIDCLFSCSFLTTNSVSYLDYILIFKIIFNAIILSIAFRGLSHTFSKQDIEGLAYLGYLGIILVVFTSSFEIIEIITHNKILSNFFENQLAIKALSIGEESFIRCFYVGKVTLRAFFIAGFFVLGFTRIIEENHNELTSKITEYFQEKKEELGNYNKKLEKANKDLAKERERLVKMNTTLVEGRELNRELNREIAQFTLELQENNEQLEKDKELLKKANKKLKEAREEKRDLEGEMLHAIKDSFSFLSYDLVSNQ